MIILPLDLFFAKVKNKALVEERPNNSMKIWSENLDSHGKLAFCYLSGLALRFHDPFRFLKTSISFAWLKLWWSFSVIRVAITKAELEISFNKDLIDWAGNIKAEICSDSRVSLSSFLRLMLRPPRSPLCLAYMRSGDPIYRVLAVDLNWRFMTSKVVSLCELSADIFFDSNDGFVALDASACTLIGGLKNGF